MTPHEYRHRVTPEVHDESAPSWAEICAYGDFLQEREKRLRIAGTFYEQVNIDETDRLTARHSRMRQQHHERHGSKLRIVKPGET